MKVNILSLGLFFLFLGSNLYCQGYEVFDYLDWSKQAGQSGSTDGGMIWSAFNNEFNNCDSIGFIGPDEDGFYIADWEGTCGCDCIPDDPAPKCGANNNKLDILFSPFVIQSYCSFKVSFEVKGNEELRCGINDDLDPLDYIKDICNDDRGDWEGTDFLSIQYILFYSDGKSAIFEDLICGSSGLGLIEREFEDAVFVQISFSGGTQLGGVYEIGNITAEGILKELGDLRIFAINHSTNGFICENSGLPLILQTNADTDLDFVWMGPQGVISTRPVVQLNDLDPNMSGSYMVRVTDKNGCVSFAQTMITVKDDSDGDCNAAIEFSQLFPIMCSDVILPNISDNGIKGRWSPGANLVDYVGETRPFTFIPDDPSINQYSINITVDDLSLLPEFARQPRTVPIFCNGPGLSYDLIDIFDMNLDYALTINGDGEIFNFIINDSYVHQREAEIRNVNFQGITPGVKNYFIEAISPCGELSIKSFQFIVLGTETLVIDTILCEGNVLNYFGSEIINDTVFYDSECAAAIEFRIDYKKPQINLETYEGSFCAGDLVYIYDTLDSSNNWVGLSSVELPQYVHALDTVFSSSFIGEYILPIPASNGCDSIMRINIDWPIPQKFNNIRFDLCSDRDTSITIGGTDRVISSANAYLEILVECDSLVTIDANIIPVETDTIRATLCAGKDTLIEDLQGNLVLFNKDNSTQLFYSEPFTGGCRSSVWVDIDFIESEKGRVDAFICQGEFVVVGNQFFTQLTRDQEVILPQSDRFGCDSIVIVNVDILSAKIDASPQVITCTSPEVRLTVDHNGEIESWQGPNGFFSTEESPLVSQQGIYRVTIKGPNGCTSTFSKVVSRDIVPPTVQAFGGRLNCNSPSLFLSAATNGSVVRWSGPDNFSSDLSSPFITVPGVYEVTVESANGCIAVDSTEVTADFEEPTATLQGGILNCANDAQVTLNVETPDIFIGWTRPDGFESAELAPVVTMPGVYTALIEGTNGCMSTFDALVEEDTRVPDVTINGGILNCTNNSGVTLIAETSDSIMGWEGPGGYQTTEQSPTISTPGIYTVTVQADNGCVTSETISIAEDKTEPVIILGDTILNCSIREIDLIAQTDGTITGWTGPDGYNTYDDIATISAPGIYEVRAINENSGCVSTAELTVAIDTTQPSISIISDTIDCNTPEVTLLLQTDGKSISWTGPGGFESNTSAPVVSTEGLYKVEVTGENGCSEVAEGLVFRDSDTPTATLQGGILTCANDVQVTLNVETPDIFIGWTGPDGFESAELAPVVTMPGVYTALIEGTNGCESTFDILVEEDTRVPDVIITGGILNCTNNSRVTLIAETSDSVIGWEGPGGYQTTEQSPNISTPGIYTVTVQAENGCVTSETISIAEDKTEPVILVGDTILNCSITEIDLIAQTDGTITGWTGPEGYNTNEDIATISAPGIYEVSAINEINGCVNTAELTVAIDTTQPSISIISDTIDCNTPEVTLLLQTNGNTISWTGPGGFESNTSSPVVSTEGLYTVEVTVENGCSEVGEVLVIRDSDTPTAALQGGILTCANDAQVTLNIETLDIFIGWTGPDGFESAILAPVVTIPGVYTALVEGTNGCESTFDILVEEDTRVPDVTITGGILNCTNNSRVTLIAETSDSIMGWEGPGGYQTTEQSPIISTPGEYTVTVQSENGCETKETIEIPVDTIRPTLTSANQIITCDMTSVVLTANTDGQFSGWTGPEGFTSTEMAPQVNIPGIYTALAIGENGCSSSLAITVSIDTISPEMRTGDLIIDCTQDEFRLELVSNTANIIWSGPDGFISSATDPVVSIPGLYTVTATGINGCSATEQALVTINQAGPTVQISTVSDFSCIAAGAEIAVSTDADQINWRGPDAFQSNTSTITVFTSGTYYVSAMGNNGCTTSDSVTINFSELSLQIGDVIGSCEGVANGSFSLEGFPGAAPPFQLSGMGIDQTIVDFPFTLDQLASGQYNFTVTDANGCSEELLITIPDEGNPDLDIDIITIDPIGQYDLFIDFDGTIDTIIWEDVPGLSCYDCINPQVSIKDDALFLVTIFDANGCSSSASVLLKGNDIGTIYVPNIFNAESPNGNNNFYPQGNFDKETYYDMQIFDRWGNEVYQVKKALLNQPESGWRGRSKGALVSSGVYVYCITVYNDFGAEKIIKGDITFLR